MSTNTRTSRKRTRGDTSNQDGPQDIQNEKKLSTPSDDGEPPAKTSRHETKRTRNKDHEELREEQANKEQALQDEMRIEREKAAAEEKRLQTEISKLKDELAVANKEHAGFEDKLKYEKQVITDQYSSQIKRKDEEIRNKEKEIQNKQVEIESLHGNLQQLQNKLNEYVKNKDSEVKSMHNEIQQKENVIKQLTRQRDEEKTAREKERHQKDEALTRLSAVAGDRLRNNNPGITDLSDPNRPMKIAEKVTEMYDNGWTDAMEALEELQIEGDQCVEILLHFLTDAYEECEQIRSELDSHLVRAVTVTVSEDVCMETDTSDQSLENLPAELTKPIRDLRRKFAAHCVDELQKKIPHHLKEKRHLTDEHMKACEHFIADCIKYAWMMQIQDTPVHIEWKFPKGSKIDTNILRSYTKAGDHVDFVVWPVLYLHKGGPVLNKGVVQPRQNK